MVQIILSCIYFYMINQAHGCCGKGIHCPKSHDPNAILDAEEIIVEDKRKRKRRRRNRKNRNQEVDVGDGETDEKKMKDGEGEGRRKAKRGNHERRWRCT